MNELTDENESGLGWVYPPQPQTEVVTIIEGIVSGITVLTSGQGYVDVDFGSDQSSSSWTLIETSIVNTTDGTPVNVWPGVVTSKTAGGFRLQLNGTPDSGNYYLHWSIKGAFGYLFTGPTSGEDDTSSTPFTVTLPEDVELEGVAIITPSDGGIGGSFTPATVSISTADPVKTFTYTPSTVGLRTISVTNDRTLNNPASLPYESIAPSYPYYLRELTIDFTLVPSTQTNFPVLVSVTDATLKSEANGGHVQRDDGFDILFAADALGDTILDYEIDRYDETTGELVAWIKIPSVSGSENTLFYLLYGDPAITSDQSDPVNTWSNGFTAVYHLGNGTVLNADDSKTAFDGTIINSATAGVGQIDGAGVFNGTDQRITVAAAPTTAPPMTLSAWVKTGAGGNQVAIGITKGAINATGFWLDINATDVRVVTGDAGITFGVSTRSGFTTGTWHYATGVITSDSSRTAYRNGIAGTTNTDPVTPGTTPDNLDIADLFHSGLTHSFWDGSLDEVHVANVARSTDWIVTEYNNQSAPGTFVDVGAET